MALGKRCGSGLGLGSGVVRYTRSMSGKRIAISSHLDVDFPVEMKKHCNEKKMGSETLPLEALPQDVLVRILCGVDHDDLKQLFHVSKLIREATLVAKKWHFEYSTPRKNLPFRNVSDLEGADDIEEVEAPNAPTQSRFPKSRLNRLKLASISVALFTDEEAWPRRNISMEKEANT